MQTLLRAAMPRSARSISASPSADPRSSGAAWRIEPGTVSAMRASSESAPTVRSMSRRSAADGPIWRAAKSNSPATMFPVMVLNSRSMQQGLVGGLVEQRGGLARIGQAQGEQPPPGLGRAVDQRRIAGKAFVDLGNRAAQGREDLEGGLDRLDDRRDLAFGQRFPDRRQLDEDDV